MNKAVFFDKDGVLNTDKGVKGTSEPVELFEGIGGLIAHFRSLGYKIVVITNQPIVARGIISEQELFKQLGLFEKALLAQNSSAKIDKIYYCPHHPNANVEAYRVICDCRKPKPGLLKRACKELNIDCKASFMVGDRISDIVAGHLAGCRTIQFMSGMHTEKMIETDLPGIEDIRPDYTISRIDDLKGIIQ